jgi:transposase
MENRTRRKFDKAFKKMVVELFRSGKTSTEVGEELGIGPDMVRRWNREFSVKGESSFAGNGKQVLSDEQREIAELKKALLDAQVERDILKKAVSIFSRSDNKYSGS